MIFNSYHFGNLLLSSLVNIEDQMNWRTMRHFTKVCTVDTVCSTTAKIPLLMDLKIQNW